MSKKGGKGVLKRLFSKDGNPPEASSSAGGTVTEKKKKKVRVGERRFLSDLLTFFSFFQKGSVSGLKVHSVPSSVKATCLVYAATTPSLFASSIAVRAETPCCTQVGPARISQSSHRVNDPCDLSSLAIMAP